MASHYLLVLYLITTSFNNTLYLLLNVPFFLSPEHFWWLCGWRFLNLSLFLTQSAFSRRTSLFSHRVYYIVRLLACNFDVINLKAFAVGICNCVFSHVFICVCVCICFHIQQNCKVHSQFWLSSKAFLSAWKTHLNWSELSWFVDLTISVHLLPQLSSFSSSFLFSCFL